MLEKHIKPKLGGCFPLGISTGVIDDFTHELLFDDGLAIKTVHDILVGAAQRFEIHGDSVSGGLPGNRNQLPQREPKGNARVVTG